VKHSTPTSHYPSGQLEDPTCWEKLYSQSYITTDSLSVSPSRYQAPTWNPRPIFSIFDFFFLLSGLLMWGALSDEKSGQYFSVFGGHRQRSLPQI
jgi:hypothetical protein